MRRLHCQLNHGRSLMYIHRQDSDVDANCYVKSPSTAHKATDERSAATAACCFSGYRGSIFCLWPNRGQTTLRCEAYACTPPSPRLQHRHQEVRLHKPASITTCSHSLSRAASGQRICFLQERVCHLWTGRALGTATNRSSSVLLCFLIPTLNFGLFADLSTERIPGIE